MTASEIQELVDDNITLRYKLKKAEEENGRLYEKYYSLLNKYGDTAAELLKILHL